MGDVHELLKQSEPRKKINCAAKLSNSPAFLDINQVEGLENVTLLIEGE